MVIDGLQDAEIVLCKEITKKLKEKGYKVTESIIMGTTTIGYYNFF